jgi:hypothetical protein
MKKAFLAIAIAVFGINGASAQISITTSGTTTQTFDTLPASGSATFTDNSTIPGWYAQRTGTGTTIVAGDGSNNAGNLYSYGTGTAIERALGSVGSGNAAQGSFAWGVQFQNNSGNILDFGILSYTGEQWRNSAAAAQTMTLWYMTSSSAITSLTPGVDTAWTPVASLDFSSPVTGGSASALDGNLAANRTLLSFDLGISLNPGEFIMFRWSDIDHSGSDHGLAIDDFSIAYNVVPEPATIASILLGAGLLAIGRRRK